MLQGIPIIMDKKPTLKYEDIKTLILFFAFIFMASILISVSGIFIRSYGFSYANIVIGSSYFYFSLVILLAFLIFMVNRLINHQRLIKTSCTVVGIQKEYALQILFHTLENMNLTYQNSVSGIYLTEKNINIDILVGDQEIRFSTTQPIDKIFLRQLCKAYCQQYHQDAAPISKKYAILLSILGILCFGLSSFLLTDLIIVSSMNTCRSGGFFNLL
jgi:hypothetical protein